jgi:integrase
MKNKIRLNFMLRFSDDKKKPYFPIYVNLKVNSKTEKISLNHRILARDWNYATENVKPNNKNAILINAKIDMVRNNLESFVEVIRIIKEIENVRNVKERLGISEDNSSLSFTNFFERHLLDIDARVGKDATATYQRNLKSTLLRFKKFTGIKYPSANLLVTAITPSLVIEFVNYLRNDVNLAHNRTMQHLKILKSVMGLAETVGIVNANPIKGIPCLFKPATKHFLTIKELNKIIVKNSLKHRLAVVKDVFLFCCFTGLTYQDVSKLRKSNIKTDPDGNRIIAIRRGNSLQESQIKLTPRLESMIFYYNGYHKNARRGKLFPVFNNKEMNENLILIAAYSGVYKRITFNMARNTYAKTVALGFGVSLSDLKLTLGLKTIRSANMYEKSLKNDVRELRETGIPYLKNINHGN